MLDIVDDKCQKNLEQLFKEEKILEGLSEEEKEFFAKCQEILEQQLKEEKFLEELSEEEKEFIRTKSYHDVLDLKYFKSQSQRLKKVLFLWKEKYMYRRPINHKIAFFNQLS